MKPRRLLPAADCPHLTLDTRTVPATCRQCGTPWALIQANDRGVGPTLFGKPADTRLALHAAGQHCPGCGTTHYPHERGGTP